MHYDQHALYEMFKDFMNTIGKDKYYKIIKEWAKDD